MAIMFILSACIAACQKPDARRYVALKDVPIYREPLDGTTDVVYTVKKGEACVFGREVTKKVYLFKEVTCGNAHGWTPDWADFDEVKG
jgi:hypothetical protein